MEDKGKGLKNWSVQMEGQRDGLRSAKYPYLFSTPLMGHIPLAALCLHPNCKGYVASHLQELPHNKDHIGLC